MLLSRVMSLAEDWNIFCKKYITMITSLMAPNCYRFSLRLLIKYAMYVQKLNSSTQVVLLCPDDPDDIMKELLLKYLSISLNLCRLRQLYVCLYKSPFLYTFIRYSPQNRLFYIKGDARIHDDLHLAVVERQSIFIGQNFTSCNYCIFCSAASCYILTDREAQDPKREDSISVLRVSTHMHINFFSLSSLSYVNSPHTHLSLSYINQAMSILAFDMNITVYVQIIEPASKRYLLQSGIKKSKVLFA